MAFVLKKIKKTKYYIKEVVLKLYSKKARLSEHARNITIKDSR